MACKLALDLFPGRCRVIFMDTFNEDEDTYRFKADCEKLYGQEIETITMIGNGYDSIQDVWRKHLSLNVANGAICSSVLKRKLREDWQKENTYTHQVFGFEFESREFNRALSLSLNHPKAKPIFPLLMMGLTKIDCINSFKEYAIEIPAAYRMGFKNSNCIKTGCVQGGVGYWQKIKRDFPDKFDAMAAIEHELTDSKGYPVTMLRDQSVKAKTMGKYDALVFLKKHPNYTNKSIDEMSGREPEPLTDCNGFCGVNELNKKSKTEGEINYENLSMDL